MVNKELCFIIENVKLYLEQVLVDYDGFPVFFLCRGRNQYYAILNAEMSSLHYYIVKLSTSDVYSLLHGKIPIRNIILKQKTYWDVVSGDEIWQDIVTKKDIDSIDASLLPEENAYFRILTTQMQSFVQEFNNAFSKDSDRQ